MKFIVLLLLLTSFGAGATTEARCRLVDGIYTNSESVLEDLAIETYADVFTINNANTITLKLNNEVLRFVRSELIVDRHTKMFYLEKTDRREIRAMHVTLDRTPRQIAKSHHFFGYMILTSEIAEGGDYHSIVRKDSLNYNFFCSF